MSNVNNFENSSDNKVFGVVIDSQTFNPEIGAKICKLKYKDSPDKFIEIFGFDYNTIEDISASEILSLDNVEQRRIGLKYFTVERFFAEYKFDLIDTKTLDKKTTWVDDNGNLIEKSYKDTYKLYKSKNPISFRSRIEDSLYVLKFKDTSTDREYLLWVDGDSVRITNDLEMNMEINATQAIAWSFLTTILEDEIKKIVRQGDCVLFMPNENFTEYCSPRHLKEKEYLTLLCEES